MRRALIIVLPALTLVGCLAPQSQDTPAAARRLIEPKTGTGYWLYVPSYWQAERQWPLVVTLHGATVWDSSSAQIKEWKHLAEKRGLVVAAPDLRTPSFWGAGGRRWLKNLQRDEQAVLAIMDAVSREYRVADRAVLLTGFLEGGYPLYHVGLRNAERLGMLIARDCYCDAEALAEMPVTQAARDLPMVILIGKHGWLNTSKDGWTAYRILRQKECFNTRRKEVRGGQTRKPERAYDYWLRHQLPAALRR